MTRSGASRGSIRPPAARCASRAPTASPCTWSTSISDQPSGREDAELRDSPESLRKAIKAADITLYSLGEEIAHSITHGLGAVLSVAGLCVLVARAALYGNVWHIVACSVFGSTLVLMYTASTLYHSIPLPRTKVILRIIDHSMIYFLIAGTYTPFALVTLQGPYGWGLFFFTWGLAVLGVAFKIVATGRFEKLSLAIYLAMGWCALVAIKPLIAAMPPLGLALLAAGGLSYTGGVVFYTWHSLRYHHAIWHLFVLAGSLLHYFTVLFFVVPSARG